MYILSVSPEDHEINFFPITWKIDETTIIRLQKNCMGNFADKLIL